MPKKLEDYIPVVMEAGVVTNKAASFGGATTFASATATTAGGAVGIRMGSAATAPGIYFGSGVPTVTAPQGSLYLRTDGTTTNNRMYVNTDRAATWTGVTTAA